MRMIKQKYFMQRFVSILLGNVFWQAATVDVLEKKVFSEILQNSQENICARDS